MDTATARITIARTSDTDVQQRQVIVSVDDGPKATLVFGQSVSWDLPPGPHVLKANNTLIWKKVAVLGRAGRNHRVRHREPREPDDARVPLADGRRPALPDDRTAGHELASVTT